MTGYTPTTEDVRGDYIAHSATYAGKPSSESGAEFDRWLADVIRKAKEQAWEEGITASGINLDWQLHLLDHNPYTEES